MIFLSGMTPLPLLLFLLLPQSNYSLKSSSCVSHLIKNLQVKSVPSGVVPWIQQTEFIHWSNYSSGNTIDLDYQLTTTIETLPTSRSCIQLLNLSLCANVSTTTTTTMSCYPLVHQQHLTSSLLLSLGSDIFLPGRNRIDSYFLSSTNQQWRCYTLFLDLPSMHAFQFPMHIAEQDVFLPTHSFTFKPRTTDFTNFIDQNEIGYLSGTTRDHWWYDERTPLGLHIFNIQSLYKDSRPATNDNQYLSHAVANDPMWAKSYAQFIIKFCQRTRGRLSSVSSVSSSCSSFLELGSAGCYATEHLIEATRSVNQSTHHFVAVEGVLGGINTCLHRGIPSSRLIQHDLRLPLALHQKFDVAISTEVAEHLEGPFSSTLVLSLVAHSDVIWWSSALPPSQKPLYPYNHVHQ